MNIRLLILAALAITVIIIASFFFAPDGEEIFRIQGCIGCHSIRRDGGIAGPELAPSARRRSYLYLRAQIRDPKSHNPDSRMPSYGHLSEAEIFALIRYLRKEND